ncbi:MAG: hypothetical protein EKK64_08925 [Neisseriaceae bacterium]|nr:MAG: hypothetical protein EKK64_08925 [Neisseriaceae bacterium]
MKKLLLLQLSSACFIVACSVGHSNVTYQKPIGPVSYSYINGQFESKATSKLVLNNANATSGCGQVLSKTSSGLGIASGFMSFIPVAGPALGVITSATGSVLGLFGSAKGNNCTNQQFENMQIQLANQSEEINNLETDLDLSNNEIWQQMQAQASLILNTNYILYNSQISNISGDQGLLYSFMYKSGFWNPDSGMPVTNFNIESALTSASYSSLSGYINSYTGLDQQITNIAGVIPTSNNSSGFNTVIIKENASDYINLLSSLYNYLNNILVTSAQSNNNNIVPYVDQYNQVVLALYQKSLYAVNQAYMVSYLINQINYQNYVTGGNQPYLADISGIYGTYFNPNYISYNYGSQLDYYNASQQNLSILYAQIVNQLYSNTLNYIVTDSPVGNQSYPNAQTFSYQDESGQLINLGESINYSALVGSSVMSATSTLIDAMQNSSPTNGVNLANSLKLAMSNSKQQYSTLFYQAPYFSNAASCTLALSQYNYLNGTNGSIQDFYQSESGLNSCQPLLLGGGSESVTASIMSWSTIQPYYANVSQQSPVLYGSVSNNIAASNTNYVGSISPYSLYVYTPNGSTPSLGRTNVPYLMSGNWSLNGFSNQIIFSNMYYDFYGYMPNKNWENATAIGYQSSVGNGNITFMGGSQTNWSANGHQNYNLSNGTSQPYIYYGWMNVNYPSGVSKNDVVSNLSAIQVTFPDGFIASLGIMISNITDWTGYYGEISINPNLLNVQIDGNPLLSGYGSANIWGGSGGTCQSSDGMTLCDSTFTLNNNLLVAGGTSASIGGWGDFILYSNPTSCSWGAYFTEEIDGYTRPYAISSINCSY